MWVIGKIKESFLYWIIFDASSNLKRFQSYEFQLFVNLFNLMTLDKSVSL